MCLTYYKSWWCQSLRNRYHLFNILIFPLILLAPPWFSSYLLLLMKINLPLVTWIPSFYYHEFQTLYIYHFQSYLDIEYDFIPRAQFSSVVPVFKYPGIFYDVPSTVPDSGDMQINIYPQSFESKQTIIIPCDKCYHLGKPEVLILGWLCTGLPEEMFPEMIQNHQWKLAIPGLLLIHLFNTSTLHDTCLWHIAGAQ